MACKYRHFLDNNSAELWTSDPWSCAVLSNFICKKLWIKGFAKWIKSQCQAKYSSNKINYKTIHIFQFNRLITPLSLLGDKGISFVISLQGDKPFNPQLKRYCENETNLYPLKCDGMLLYLKVLSQRSVDMNSNASLCQTLFQPRHHLSTSVYSSRSRFEVKNSMVPRHVPQHRGQQSEIEKREVHFSSWPQNHITSWWCFPQWEARHCWVFVQAAKKWANKLYLSDWWVCEHHWILFFCII